MLMNAPPMVDVVIIIVVSETQRRDSPFLETGKSPRGWRVQLGRQEPSHG